MTPFYGQGSTTSRLQSHFKEAAYFLPLSSQNFLVFVLLTFEGLKAELILEPLSCFEHGIQQLNHYTILIKIIKHHKGTNIYQLGDGNYFAAIENSKNSNSIGKTTWKSIKMANMSFKIKNNAIVFGELVKLMTTKLGHYTIPISLNKTVLNNLTPRINTNKTLITTQTNISKYDIATKL